MPHLQAPPSQLKPIPLALVSLRVSDGSLRLLGASWVGVVCTRPHLLTVGLRGAADLPGVRPGATFEVTLPSGGPPDAPALRVDCRLHSLSRRYELTLLCGEVMAVRLPGEASGRVSMVDLCALLAGGLDSLAIGRENINAR